MTSGPSVNDPTVRPPDGFWPEVATFPGVVVESSLGPWFEALPNGKAPKLLVTAPHAVVHRRDGHEKVAEGDTGTVARSLGSFEGAAAMIAMHPQHGDANWDDSHPFVLRASSLGSAQVLDLHIMKPRGPLVCLGTGDEAGKSGPLLDMLISALLRADVPFSVNWPFRGSGRPLTSQIQRRGGMAVQVELSYSVFNDPSERVALLAVREAVEQFLSQYSRCGNRDGER
jgi:hypothetical protein